MSSNTSGTNSIEATSRNAFPRTTRSRGSRWDTREGDVRARIFKMTQARDNISFIYRESLRGMISAFNDVGYIDSEDKFNQVKCIHANAERAIAKLKQENNIILPVLSISQTVSDNDDSRRRNESVLVHEKYWDKEKNRAFRILSLSPRAVNIRYKINIWCKYMSDMDQILEQLRLKFNPEMEVYTKFSTLAKASIESEEDTGSVIAGDKEDRVIRKTLNIVLRTYIPNPKFLVTSTGKIEEFNAEITTYGDSSFVATKNPTAQAVEEPVSADNPSEPDLPITEEDTLSNLYVTYSFTPSGESATVVSIPAPYEYEFTEHTYYDDALGRDLTTSCYEDFRMSNGFGLLTQWERFPGYDATRITTTLVNGVKYAGVIPLERLSIKVGNNLQTLKTYNGRFSLLPGGIYPFRTCVGRHSTSVENYAHLGLTPIASHNQWIETLCDQALTEKKDEILTPFTYGPFDGCWSNYKGDNMYDGSHGGWNIQPRGGGIKDWKKIVPSAWKYQETEMLKSATRSPLARIDTLGSFVIDPAEYQQNRSLQYDSEGWTYAPLMESAEFRSLSGTVWETMITPADAGYDNTKIGKAKFKVSYAGHTAGDIVPYNYYWFPYESEFQLYKAPNKDHLIRAIRAPGAVATQDAFARWYLRAIFNDTLNDLAHNGTDTQYYVNKNYLNISQMLATDLPLVGGDNFGTPVQNIGVWWAGRSFAHQMRTYLYARPYLSQSEDQVNEVGQVLCDASSIPQSNGSYHTWFDIFKFALETVSTPYGITHREFGHSLSDTETGVNDIGRSREFDLIGILYQDFGLASLSSAWVNYCAPIVDGGCVSSIAGDVRITASASVGDYTLTTHWSDYCSDYEIGTDACNPTTPCTVPGADRFRVDPSQDILCYIGGGQPVYDGFRNDLSIYNNDPESIEIAAQSDAVGFVKQFSENVWDSFDRKIYLDTI